MGFDFESYLGAVERSVASLERDGRPARAITLSRSYPTTACDLWDAVTNGERIPRWFCRYRGNSSRVAASSSRGMPGARSPRVSRPPVSRSPGSSAGTSVGVEVRIADDGAGGARLALTHTALLSEHWDRYGPGATGVGWGGRPPGAGAARRAAGRAEAGRSRVRRFR